MSTEGNKAENKVEFGLRNAHYAPVTIDETANKMTFGTPVKIPGAVTLTLNASGDMIRFKADDCFFMQFRHINLHGNILCQHFLFIEIIQKAPQGRHFPCNTGRPILLLPIFSFIIF